jgi:Uma2 family endonuclease
MTYVGTPRGTAPEPGGTDPDPWFRSVPPWFRQVGPVHRIDLIDREIQGAPEIAAEILSPSNSRRAMQRKLTQFFATGCNLAWIIDPKAQTVEVWESSTGPSRVLRGSDSLETPLLPGFTILIAKLF